MLLLMDTLEIPNTPEQLQKDKKSNRVATPGIHACNVCKIKNRMALEERYAQGWRVLDLAKRYSVKFSDLEKHLRETGLEKKFAKQRMIKIDEFCDEIIRAALPLLEGKSATKGLYVRDAIDAAKVKMKIKDQRKIEELWESVDQISKEAGAGGPSAEAVNSTVNRLAKVVGQEGNVENL